MKALLALILLASGSAAFAVTETSTAPLTEQGGDKTLLIRVEPHWLIMSEAAFDFQFKVTDKFTLGPTIALMNGAEGIYYGTKVSTHLFAEDKTDRQTYGLKGSYYFRGVERSSAYISGFGRYAMNQVSVEDELFTSGSKRTGKFNETSFGVSGGYQWMFGQLFTLNIGGGLANYTHPESIEMTDRNGKKTEYDLDDSGIGIILDAGLGFIF